MFNTVVIILLSMSLIVTAALGFYTLLRCDSRKSVSFIAVLASAFMYTLGYMMQTAAGNVDKATVASWVTFMGSSYLVSSYLYFVAEYCEVRIRKVAAVFLIGVPFAYIILVFTTDYHGLILAAYEYVTSTPVNYLEVTPGPLYYVLHVYALICMIAMLVLVVPRFSKSDSNFRINLILLTAGAVFFLLMNLLFLLKIMPYGVNLVHSAVTVLVLLLYYSIMRYNLIDVTPIASEMALASVRDAFIVVDKNNKLLRANEAACSLFPRLRDMQKGSPIWQIEGWPAELILGYDHETVTFGIGEENYYTASINVITSKKKRIIGGVIIIQDTTESVKLTKTLEGMAYTDSLTGIYNRRYFVNQVAAQFERTMRNNAESYIVIFDVDHFKKINDTYGHAVGDEVLKAVVNRVNGAIRGYDLFGRYGGEEFILSVPDINEENIMFYMERLRVAICNTPVCVGELHLNVSASFGASKLTSENGIAAAIKSADEALYAAKRDGRNRVVMSLSETNRS